MRKKMLKAAGVLILSLALSMGMAGCAGKGDGGPGTGDTQDITLRDSDETGSNREPDSPEVQDAELNHADGAGDSSEIKGGKEAESDREAANSSSEGEAASNGKGIFYDGANLSGRVVDFTDTGFTITPRTLIINEDGSMEGGIAAPGYESEETNIHITYAEDVVFQVIYFSMGSQTEISREDTDKKSVKIETDVNIFGTCQDETHWTADKVVITRWR